MKSTRRFFALVLCLVMCLAFFPASASAAGIVAAGNCGPGGASNAQFKLYTDGRLIITGTGSIGPMTTWSFTSGFDGGYSAANDAVYQTRSMVKTLEIGEGIRQINADAFRECPSMTSVELPLSLTDVGGTPAIGQRAFQDCSSLNNVYIPSNVQSIGASAFQNCASLTSIYLSDGLTTINDQAFRDCVSLRSITIPANVTLIGGQAFANCNSLKEIIFTGNYPAISGDSFRNVTAKVYYPVDNNSWNQNLPPLLNMGGADFGGRLTWDASTAYTGNDGWVQKGNDWYYYMGGVMVRSNWVAYQNRWFYFGENGRMYIGRQQIGDKFYYFGRGNGVDGHELGARVSGWVNDGGTNYFYDDNGVWQPGYSGVNDSGLNMFRNGWQQSADGKWFYIKDQAKLKGWIKWSNNWYYLDPTTGAMVTGWLDWQGNTYYLNPPNGEMIAGQNRTIGGTSYSFDSEGRLMGGQMDNNPLGLTTGWRQVGGSWYFYRSDGSMISGEWELIDGSWYYFDSNGKVKTGWLSWNGDWYYLRPGTPPAGGVMLTGFQDISSTPQGVQLAAPKRYFFKSNGALNGKGWIQIGGKWYYLRDDGSLQTGWLKDGGNWFYLDDGTNPRPNGTGNFNRGEMVTGVFNVPATCDGKPNDQPGTHSFKANGVWLGAGNQLHNSTAGSWKNNDGWRYYDTDGVALTGWQYIDGKWYYLDPASSPAGKMRTGFINDGTGWYYCDGQGVMQKGWQKIDGTWYLFDGNGARVTGWYQAGDGKWYYLNPENGGMISNATFEVDGEYWQFNADGVCTGKVAG